MTTRHVLHGPETSKRRLSNTICTKWRDASLATSCRKRFGQVVLDPLNFMSGIDLDEKSQKTDSETAT